ncbi:porin [Bradyrhizobium sp. CCGUVB1N3]|uniref:porin n=1 Tax=Bradyrhizobium sp. CCGUVB1N3 TaxID=2949629 RepID=UPI0020B39243|nr:porin [Bradyrhizobium sp. CCGUVB1N3]MCP3470448.1 porin [Bradyrhizobium sp. CCGUVB1N3]
MKLVKSLLLGSAAGLIAVGGAQAADLPVKAKAVEYVKICSLYGAGFYYMPGTDTCIKFGGYVRADLMVNSGNDYGFNTGAPDGAQNRLRNNFTSRARMDLTVDTRTATEYGVVRTYADMVFTWTGGSYVGAGNVAPGTSFNTSGGATLYNSTTGTIGGASLGLYHAFIQFAGFTFGRTVSIFDAPWQSYPAGGPDTMPGGSNHVTGVNQVAYTADFGQGITGSVALQDPTVYDTTNIWNLSFPGGTSPSVTAGVVNFFGGYGAPSIGAGMVAPDIVGAVRVDQAWGLFQFSAVAHDNHASYYGSTEVSGHPSDKWGWAVQASLSIKNIPTGPGDSINLQAVYTDGASRYNFQSLFPTGIAMFGGTSTPGAYQSLGFAAIGDAVFVNGSSLETVKTWGFRGGYTHNWSPNWASGIYGAYGVVDYGSLATTAICANAVASLGLTGNCNPDFNFAVVGANVVWTPLKNLAFTADVNWTHLDQKYSGTVFVTPPATFAKPQATYELRDQNSVTMLLRAQRNF